ncbi:MAG: flagellar biosynthesis anti-sigma factor FlgM [Proteobacteria bacterium]|nr:flagellar biosynthesis anti-sigma factor FlgM [Pseudomonadota bacterium]
MNKIGPNPTQSPPENRSAKQAVVASISGERKTAAQNTVSRSGDTVALSTQAVDMNALEITIKQLPEIDAARVVELHTRIVDGDYKIDADRLAAKLLDFESTLDS